VVFIEHHGVIAAIGSSQDEAMEALYQCVSDFLFCQQQEETQRRASYMLPY